jgi:hypothetical protein
MNPYVHMAVVKKCSAQFKQSKLLSSKQNLIRPTFIDSISKPSDHGSKVRAPICIILERMGAAFTQNLLVMQQDVLGFDSFIGSIRFSICRIFATVVPFTVPNRRGRRFHQMHGLKIPFSALEKRMIPDILIQNSHSLQTRNWMTLLNGQINFPRRCSKARF